MYTILRTTTGCSVVFVCKHIYIYYIIHSIDFNSAAVQFPAIILITVIMFICHLLVQPLCPASTALAEATGIPHHFFGGKVVGGCPYNMGSRSVWVSTSLEYSDHLTTIKMHWPKYPNASKCSNWVHDIFGVVKVCGCSWPFWAVNWSMIQVPLCVRPSCKARSSLSADAMTMGFQAISARFNGSSPNGFWNIQTEISGGIRGTYYYYIYIYYLYIT